MQIKKRLPSILAVLLALLVVSAGLWAPHALFAIGDNALYTTHPAARAGGSLAVRPDDLPLVRSLRAVESHYANGGYWSSYENTWETPEEVAQRMQELAAPLQELGMLDEPSAGLFWEDVFLDGFYPSHSITSAGFENLSVYGQAPGSSVGMYLQVEMATGLLTSIELSAQPKVFNGGLGLNIEEMTRAYADYLGLSVFTDWALYTTRGTQGLADNGSTLYVECLLYSSEARIAVYGRYMDYRAISGREPGRLTANVWVDSTALNPDRPRQWQDEQGLSSLAQMPPPSSSLAAYG